MLPQHRERINFYLRNNLWEYRTEKNRNGFYEKVYGKMYAAKTDDRSELRLHINCWDEFLEKSGIPLTELDISTKEIPKGVDVVYNVPEGFKLRDYQEKVIESVKQPNRTSVIELPMGKGKQTLLTDYVRIPNGWKKMGDVNIGDVLNMPNGDRGKVKATYDFLNEPCMEVEFVDGRSIVVGEKHLWEVFTREGQFIGHQNTRTGQYYTVDTKTLFNAFEKYKDHKAFNNGSVFRIPLIDPTHSADKEVDLPVDPYILGVVLGDGVIGKQVTIHKPDLFIQTELDRLLGEIGYQTNTLAPYFRESTKKLSCHRYSVVRKVGNDGNNFSDLFEKLGLRGKKSWEKFIPDEYLTASFDQRLALLQGLMDTDGHIGDPEKQIGRNGKRGNGASIEFSTTSIRLAYQVLELVRSVGCIAKIKQRQTYFTYKGERKPGRVSWRINIRAQIPSMLFRTPVKKNKCVDANQYSKCGLKLGIKSIKKVPSQPSRCISVDHEDQLYITNDYIVTHNTATSLNFISQFKKRLGIVVLGRYTDRWWQDVTQYARPDEILEIRGTKDLVMTIESVYDDPNYLKDIKIIMITTTTLQDYIAYYNKAMPEERKDLLPPEEIWDVLGIGIKLCDEAHQHFHANFIIDLYTHIPKEIFLSATLNVTDQFMKRMYGILYPVECRVGGGIQTKYTTCTSVRYRFKEPYKIKCKNQKKMYSHTRFEKWLMSSPRLYKRYFEVVIDPLIKSDFIPRREGKYKALVFFATTKMCGLYVEHLKSKYPELDIRRYISEDSYDNLLKADIAVSTLGSAGTAVDIKDLITCIMTTALKSEQANLQALGRLREIPGVKTDFFYLVCDNIPKHVSYHETKKWLFRSWVKSHDDYYVGDRI